MLKLKGKRDLGRPDPRREAYIRKNGINEDRNKKKQRYSHCSAHVQFHKVYSE